MLASATVRFLNYLTRFVTVLLVSCAAVGCGDDDSEPLPPPVVGGACGQDDLEVCSGDLILECDKDNGTLVWKLDNDCSAKGKHCVMETAQKADCD